MAEIHSKLWWYGDGLPYTGTIRPSIWQTVDSPKFMTWAQWWGWCVTGNNEWLWLLKGLDYSTICTDNVVVFKRSKKVCWQISRQLEFKKTGNLLVRKFVVVLILEPSQSGLCATVNVCLFLADPWVILILNDLVRQGEIFELSLIRELVSVFFTFYQFLPVYTHNH